MHRIQKHPNIYNNNISNIIDKNVVSAGDFNTALTTMDRSSRHMVNKETRALNDTLDQMDFTDTFRKIGRAHV